MDGKACMANSDCPGGGVCGAPGTCDDPGQCPGADACVVRDLTVQELVPTAGTNAAFACLLKYWSILPTTKLIMHGETRVPPRFVIDPGTASQPIPTTLHINDFSFEFLVDRDDNGATEPIGTTPNCLAQRALPTMDVLTAVASQCGPNPPQPELTGDCNLMQACIDMNFPTETEIGECLDESGVTLPAILTRPRAVQEPTIVSDVGHVCGQFTMAPAATGNADVDEKLATVSTALASETPAVLQDNAEAFTPPLCTDGMDIGGFSMFTNPAVFAIQNPVGQRSGECDAASAVPGDSCETNADCGGGTCLLAVGQDFLGMTGDIVTGMVINTGEGCTPTGDAMNPPPPPVCPRPAPPVCP
jgi:hypothetical protein